MRSLVLVTIMLAGCSQNPPVAPEGLKRPASWAMERCKALSEIPAGDGDPKKRFEQQFKDRQEHVECAAKVDALIAYVEVVAPRKK
jgi:hypothetical protein